MKIYQNSTFVRTDNKIVCTINCKYVPYFCGKPIEDKAIEFTVSDYAKCHPDDDFNETYGQRLAETRASIRVYRKIKGILAQEANRVCLEINELNQDLLKNDFLLYTSEQHQYDSKMS